MELIYFNQENRTPMENFFRYKWILEECDKNIVLFL